MYITKACAATAAALTLSVPSMVRAHQATPVVKELSAHDQLREIRNAGLHGERAKIPMLIANIAESKQGERNPGQAYAEWALRSLAQLGAVEALPEIEKYDNDKSTLRLHARVTRARLLAESETKATADPAARAQATLSRFLEELKLDANKLSFAKAKLNEVRRSASHGAWPLEVLALRELADMIYHKHDVTLASAAKNQGINFEQDLHSGLLVRLAPLSDKERLSTLIQELSLKKAIKLDEITIRLAIDHGLAASRAAGAKLKQMQAERKQYPPAGFSALLDVINSVGDKDQAPVVESLLNDTNMYVAGDAQRTVTRLRSIEQSERN